MSVRSGLWIVTVIAIFSCTKDKAEAPPLSRDKMVGLLMDIYLAEARTTFLPVSKDSAYRLFLPYQDSLLVRHGVADSTLKNAYAYYLKHPVELEAIYDAVIDSLSLNEQRRRESPTQFRIGK